MKSIRRYLFIWWRLTASSFQVSFASRFGAVTFTLGKILRFLFFGFLIVLLVTNTKSFSGYTLMQSLIFYMTFNVIDTVTQLLFRDVYRFRQHVVSGDFDLILVKPMNPLFRILLGGADGLDVLVLVPYILGLLILLLQTPLTIAGVLLYIGFLINAFIIAASFHIFVLALGILTTEIDHAIMIYRDISGMVRFPVDIYQEPLRGLITFIIPVGIMMTYPAKALFLLLSPGVIIISFAIGTILFIISIRIWLKALTKYTSASS